MDAQALKEFWGTGSPFQACSSALRGTVRFQNFKKKVSKCKFFLVDDMAGSQSCQTIVPNLFPALSGCDNLHASAALKKLLMVTTKAKSGDFQVHKMKLWCVLCWLVWSPLDSLPFGP